MARSVPGLIVQGVAAGGVASLLVASGPLLPLAAVAVVVAGDALLNGPRMAQERASKQQGAPMFTPEEEAALKAFEARLDAAPDDASRRAIGEEWLPGFDAQREG